MNFQLSIVLLFSPLLVGAQIIIGPLTEGEYYNEVVYVGSYDAPGNCTWDDGTDFTMGFNGLTEVDGMEYVFVVDPPDPTNTQLMNGWTIVTVGDSTGFTPSTTVLGISAASGPAQINFHVRLVGTPSTVGQDHPCWIDAGVTEALCGNIYSLYVGESLVPCPVQSSTGINNLDNSFSVVAIDNQLKIESQVAGLVRLLQLDGKLVDQFNIESGSTTRFIETQSSIMMIQIESELGTISRKVILNDWR
jgi:hypothetical protein